MSNIECRISKFIPDGSLQMSILPAAVQDHRTTATKSGCNGVNVEYRISKFIPDGSLQMSILPVAVLKTIPCTAATKSGCQDECRISNVEYRNSFPTVRSRCPFFRPRCKTISPRPRRADVRVNVEYRNSFPTVRSRCPFFRPRCKTIAPRPRRADVTG